MPWIIEANIKIPSYTKEEYEAKKDSIPANTVFIVTDDNEDKEGKNNVTKNQD